MIDDDAMIGSMSPTEPLPLTLCCLLWARPGLAREMNAYEDTVIALLADHGASVLQRVYGDGSEGHPHEVQLYAFPSQRELDTFLADPRRQALTAERERVIERTELFPVSAAR